MVKKQKDVSLGKAAIFLGVLCALGVIATSSSGVIFYGIVAGLAGALAILCAALWLVTRTASSRTKTDA